MSTLLIVWYITREREQSGLATYLFVWVFLPVCGEADGDRVELDVGVLADDLDHEALVGVVVELPRLQRLRDVQYQPAWKRGRANRESLSDFNDDFAYCAKLILVK